VGLISAAVGLPARFFAALLDQPARFGAVFYSFGLDHSAEGFGGCFSAFVPVAGVDVV
jgi:hypothetical protein